MGINNELNCSHCNKGFKENDMAFKCEKCEKLYCYGCFCNDHFELHSSWEVFKLHNGIFELIVSEKASYKTLHLIRFQKKLFKKFW